MSDKPLAMLWRDDYDPKTSPGFAERVRAAAQYFANKHGVAPGVLIVPDGTECTENIAGLVVHQRPIQQKHFALAPTIQDFEPRRKVIFSGG